jgi:hypothetical protein
MTGGCPTLLCKSLALTWITVANSFSIKTVPPAMLLLCEMGAREEPVPVGKGLTEPGARASGSDGTSESMEMANLFYPNYFHFGSYNQSFGPKNEKSW